MNKAIQVVNKSRLFEVLNDPDNPINKGLFIYKKRLPLTSLFPFIYEVCDNTTGDAWTEAFYDVDLAVHYLYQELDDLYGLGFEVTEDDCCKLNGDYFTRKMISI